MHLNPVSGLHYILHVFDQTEVALTRLGMDTDGRLVQVQEQVRHHEDRMSYLENHHVGLQKQVSTKVAVDAEFSDWIQNRNEEDWIVIRGLPRLVGISDKEWPAAAKKQVTDCISLVLHASRTRIDFEVLHVTNPFKLRNTGPTMYNVRLDSFYTSKRLRETFSGFFRHNRPIKLPPALKGVEFRNKVTLETKVRIAILHQFGSRYTASNPGAAYKVRGFDPRPTLILIPPRSANARWRTYTFIQAVTSLPATFTDENLTRIYQVVGDRFRGKLQALFVVLNDDDHDRCLELVKASFQRAGGVPHGGGPAGAAAAAVAGSSSGAPGAIAQSFGQVQGLGHGMDVESGRHRSQKSPRPPPSEEVSVFPAETENSRAHDDRVRQRRQVDFRRPSPEPDRRGGLKRHHQSSFTESDHSDSHQKSRKKSKKSKTKKRRRRSSSSSSTDGSGSKSTKFRR